MSSSLVSAQNRVESPFIIARIGDYTFGQCSDISNKYKMKQSGMVTFPNFMKSLRIIKINGSVNTYTLQMDYAITENDDPNMLEKVFSTVSTTRKIVLSYGDWNAPAYIYKEEEALITRVQSNVDFQASKITYTLQCVSSALTLQAGTFSFGARTAKPSDVIRELLTNEAYGLTNVFSGMSNMSKVAMKSLIAADDKPVSIEAKQGINILDYIGYLVSCMVSTTDSGGAIKDANYFWCVCDDVTNEYGGTYFKVVKVASNVNFNLSGTTFEVDVGYPSGNYVASFALNTDDTWSILYEYSEKVKQPQYAYKINDDGKVESYLSPAITTANGKLSTTEESRTWWTQMTQYPITAQLTIKGLLRPSLLMSYVKVNAYFYGHKHISSGLYIITRQEDTINDGGYRTTLNLTRVGGDS